MRPYDKDKSQILAMFYYGVPIEDIKRFYKGKEQQYLFDTALMQLESEGMIKREGESFVVTKEAGDAFLCYGNYLKYVEAKRRQQVDNEKAKVLDSKVKKSTIVSNYLKSANMVCSYCQLYSRSSVVRSGKMDIKLVIIIFSHWMCSSSFIIY